MSARTYGTLRPLLAVGREAYLRSKSRLGMLWSQRSIEFEPGVRIASTVRVRGGGVVLLRAGAEVEANVTFAAEDASVIEIGRNAKIGANSRLNARAGQRLEIGDETIVESDVLIVSVAGVVTGQAAVIGARTAIVCREQEGMGAFSLGAGSHLSIDNLVDICADVAIGDDVRTGPHCAFYTHKHTPSRSELIWSQGIAMDPIAIGNAVWIGHACQVMPGVTIGDASVVGAGAVVTKPISAYSIAAGVPARQLGMVGD